jgi:hypothetical protein
VVSQCFLLTYLRLCRNAPSVYEALRRGACASLW